MIFDVHVHVMLLTNALCRIIAYMCPFFWQGTSPCLQPTVIEDTLITLITLIPTPAAPLAVFQWGRWLGALSPLGFY